MNFTVKIFSLLALSVITCSQDNGAKSEQDTKLPEIKTEEVVTGYEIIWGMDFLPDGSLIFTEKKGNIYVKKNAGITKLTGFPEVFSKNQGGLLDIRVHPDYADNGWIYACYSSEENGGKGKLNLVRFKINNDQISSLETIFSTDASNTWYGHYGSRIKFDKDNHLFLSIGEGGPVSYAGPNKKNNNAQDLNSRWGKIHRLMDDGRIPADNPVFAGATQPTSVWSYGHRNPQGLAFDPVTGELWESEHGPKGGDELNIIKKQANYGWPDYSLGVNYDGTTISKGHTATGITEPVYSWNPSIGTCGITFISDSPIESLNGNLLVSGLVTKSLHRCIIRNGTVTESELLLKNIGRVRNVIQAPDGNIYVSVENPGRIIKLTATR